jgi:replicative DNA helicase
MKQTFEHKHTERAIIACVLQVPDLLIELNGRASLDIFKDELNRKTIYLLSHLYNTGYMHFDKELIYNHLLTIVNAEIDLSQVWNYVNALYSTNVSTGNFNNYLTELVDLHLKSEVQKLLDQTSHTLYDKTFKGTSKDIISNVYSGLYNLDTVTDHSEEPVSIASQIEAHISQRLEDPEENLGIPSGIAPLDEITLGFIKKKFYFVAARPGEGKSAFLMQCSAHAAYFAKHHRTRVLYLDTEIPTDEFSDRILGHIAGVDHLSIRRGTWITDSSAAENVNRAKNVIKKVDGIYHKYIPGYKPANVINLVRKYVHNYGVGLVIFDYLKEPDEEDMIARWQSVGRMARALKDQIAGKLDVSVVSALQQNRKGDQRSRVSSDSLAESDDVFKESDVAFALNAKTADEIRKETIQAGTHRFQILKGRYTKSHYSGLNLNFYGYCLRFYPAKIQGFMEQSANDTLANANAAELPPGGLFSEENYKTKNEQFNILEH